MRIEEQLKHLIVARYDNVVTFTKRTGIPNSTFSSMMSRGILNASLSNVVKICDALQISIDALVAGQIISTANVQPPEAPDVMNSIRDICTDLATRTDLTFNGRPLSPENAEALYDLLTVSIAFYQKRQ